MRVSDLHLRPRGVREVVGPRPYFLDTSALAKLYLKERGSRKLAGWVGHTTGFSTSVRLYVSRMVLPEAISAITRRRNDRKVDPQSAVRIWNEIFNDFAGRTPYEIVEPSEAIVLRAALLVATHGLRGYDAVQLASALWLQVRLSDPDALVFVCSDAGLSKAAKAERLTVADPAV